MENEISEKATAIRLNQLTVAYEAQPVLWDISFSIPKGTLTAVVGPNGAGKSTLIKSLINLIKPIAGEVEFTFDQSTEEDYRKNKNLVAYVPQNGSVDWDFPTTVLDVVVMGRYGHIGWFKRPKKKDKSLANEMLAKVGMADFKDRQISQLSGGQRQRVFLARALVQEAEIYLMDEPFQGVDAQTEKIIIQLLKELKSEGKTIVVVHHDLQTVPEYFDEVVLINRELIGNGPIETTFTKELIAKTYRQNQAKPWEEE
ncbi:MULTISPECIES: metal ABC transporter ATP-binding protein [Carnobacterium]|uniref:Manganese ABC transporter ATP-binding protein n=2 Tax=Carnobacterium inhibens TaxID=147709 RepID=U5SBT1_9LACT|nr:MULTISPECIES: metal ABC transporter ATP-binding protein [Carnobacterium]AGY81287.1 manganese ABC transporter ATP-binding protein [Carnobacterium inhibens subsp. gilichinskyi]MBC9825204.1 ATP-binding cassette domain-containing protein [Carnobacterium inhibens]MCM3512967.1 metal ABC transporter ATP-binding protein [Carnobacterium inhibens]MDN5371055.1 manganese/zinc/iron transport system binding protein [Carnobacterium sp.]